MLAFSSLSLYNKFNELFRPRQFPGHLCPDFFSFGHFLFAFPALLFPGFCPVGFSGAFFASPGAIHGDHGTPRLKEPHPKTCTDQKPGSAISERMS
jgi:hypothetical protein